MIPAFCGSFVKGLSWLKDGDVDISQKVDSNSVVFVELVRKMARLKITKVEANLVTTDGTKVNLTLMHHFHRHCNCVAL